jgi:hypothetical protein
MTTTRDDDLFPPVASQIAEPSAPLDLSLLARVSTPITAEEPVSKSHDRPPTGRRQTGPRGTPRESTNRGTRTRKTQDTKESTPRTFVRADDEEIKEYRPGILVKPLRDLYVTVGTLTLPFNQPVGTAFIQNAEPCAKALDNAAKTDKQIRRMLMLLVQGSVWGEIIIAHMPIMMALAVTLVPSMRATMNGVQSEGSGETINPVSLGTVR